MSSQLQTSIEIDLTLNSSDTSVSLQAMPQIFASHHRNKSLEITFNKQLLVARVPHQAALSLALDNDVT